MLEFIKRFGNSLKSLREIINNELEQCVLCFKIVNKKHGVYEEYIKSGNEQFFCDVCMEELYEYELTNCDVCNIITDEYYICDICGMAFCDDCFHESHFYCPSCDEISHMEDGVFDDDGEFVCIECSPEKQKEKMEELIHLERKSPFMPYHLKRWITAMEDGEFTCPCNMFYGFYCPNHNIEVLKCPRNCQRGILYGSLKMYSKPIDFQKRFIDNMKEILEDLENGRLSVVRD